MLAAVWTIRNFLETWLRACFVKRASSPSSYHTGPNSGNDANQGLAWLACHLWSKVADAAFSPFSQRQAFAVLGSPCIKFRAWKFYCTWTLSSQSNKGCLSQLRLMYLPSRLGPNTPVVNYITVLRLFGVSLLEKSHVWGGKVLPLLLCIIPIICDDRSDLVLLLKSHFVKG